MADKSYNDIRSIAEDWQYDDRNGLAYSGKSVQKFLKDQLNDKVAATYFDPVELRLYGFKSTEDRDRYIVDKDSSLIIDTCQFNFTGTQYRVLIDNLMGSTQLYFTTQQSSAIVTVGFRSQEKGITDAEWKDKVEDFFVSVAIDKGATGNYVNIKTDESVIYGNTLSVDIKALIISGANRLKITATGKDTGATTTLVYTVNLTSMYIAPSNFTWYKPYIEGEKFVVGGLNIGGNLSKELVIKVTAEGYEPEPIRVPLGTNTYTDLAYNYEGLPFPTKGTGVYNLEIWVDANGVQTEHLSYNIICVSQADRFTAKLVCIGTAEKNVTNYADNKYFEFCVYNGGTANGEPTISLDATVNSNSTNIITETLSVATASPVSYERSLEIEAEEAQLKLVATMSYDNVQRVVFTVDNSKSYPATSGAAFYFNPSTRSNAQANREVIINAANDSAVSAEWTKMAWSDNADGYTVDEDGRKCLRLPAGSKVSINYKALQNATSRTIEFVYKVKNASDYNESCISIADDVNNAKFRGIKICPKNILLHSRDLNVQNDLQDYNTTDEELMVVTITLVRNYKTNYGNLAQIYVNGDKKRSFEFADNDSWDNNGNIVFGSDTADLYVYKARVYNRGFEKVDAMRNYRNALQSTEEKEEFTAWNEACVDDNFSLDYETCEKNGLSTMVIEMLGGGVLPNLLNQNSARCNLHLNIRSDISMLDEEMQSLLRRGDINDIRNWIIDQIIEGQGSTAMGYLRWNERWKLSIEYNKRRITAKKNVASSMHSHKMGATRLFNYLHQVIVGANDADADVAVTQFPVFGFLKVPIEGTDQYTFQPIGLYTIGADKGDKHTFGYDNEAFKETLIHLEGADHTPKGVGYDYPWDAMRYSGEKEAIGPVAPDNSVIKAFECGACGTYSPDDASDDDNIYTMLGREFRPAYDVAYLNNPHIHGVSQTLEEINANVTEWRKQTYNGKSYEDLEFYTQGEYNLYYYNEKEAKYKSTGVNVVTDLGLDVHKKTEDDIERMVIEARKVRFAEQWGNYWNTKDAIFTFCFILLIAATDNFKKNLYPYKFKSLADGGKWCHRNDDLDTIFDINNQGRSGKRYSVLVGDITETGSVFRGDNSVFWTLVKETQQEEIRKMMLNIFKAMTDKAIEVGYTGTPRQQLVGCIRHFFWDNAQEYFAPSAYNADAEWTYEDAWAIKQGSVAPLTQALGSHYEAEKDFVAMRMLFLASYYNFAPFNTEADEDKTEGQLKYRGSSSHTYRITTAADFKPMIITGESSMASAEGRVESGQTVDIVVAGTSGADTTISVQGLDWIADLGDMSTLVVSSDDSKLSIQSKRLNRIKVGDKDSSKVTCNIKSLDIGSCPSMTIVDAQNLASLTGTIDLATLPRLREAYFGGTDVRGIKIPKGAKIEKLQIPANLSTIDFQDLKYLQDFNYENLASVESMRVEGCDSINAFDLLQGAYNADNSQLKNIRITDFVADGDATDLDMLANMVNDLDKDGNPHQYDAIDADGNVVYDSNPVIDGTFNAVTPLYEDSLEVVRTNYPNLNLVDTGVYYQRFKDNEVLRVLLANNVGDGLGVVKEDWANVSDIVAWFNSNTEIVSFLELSLSNVKKLNYQAFNNCTSLETIDLTKITYIANNAFTYCANLLNVGSLDNIENIGFRAFDDCFSLAIDLNLPKLTSLGERAFEDTAILSVSAPLLGSVPSQVFTRCTSLTSVDMPNVESIGNNAFLDCTSLNSVDMPNVQTIAKDVFYGCTGLVEINMPLVKDINSQTFYGCTSLDKDFNLPNLVNLGTSTFRGSAIKSIVAPNLTQIGTHTFMNATNLSTAEFDTLTQINERDFFSCTNLKYVLIPMVKSIGLEGFSGCTALTEVEIPLVDRIVGSAFDGCASLVSVNAPKVSHLGSMVFRNCKLLSEIDLSSVQEIGINAFEGCTSLVNVDVSSAIEIPTATFYGCSALESVDASNAEAFGGSVFLGCNKLKTIQMSNAVTMGSYVFDGCKELSGDFNLPHLVSMSGYCFRGTKITSFTAPLLKGISSGSFDGCTSLTSVDIPSVENINNNAFYNATKLVGDYNLPNLTSLGSSAFRDTAITSFIAPNLTTILTQAFYSCNELAHIEFPNVTTIGTYAFQYCTSLQVVEFDNLTSIGEAAFADCSKLRTFILRVTTPPAIGVNVFFRTFSNLTIYVPDTAVDTYKNATGWADYADKIKGISELPTE